MFILRLIIRFSEEARANNIEHFKKTLTCKGTRELSSFFTFNPYVIEEKAYIPILCVMIE
jgi:hypothetical protein